MASLEAAQVGKAVAIFSLEMNADDLLMRLCSNLSGTRTKGISENPTKRELDATCRAITAIRGMKFTIRTQIRDIQALEQEVLKLAGEGKADLVVADYLQLIETNEGENRQEAVSTISRRLKNLAMGANVAIVTASQLNDAGMLRESRAIGQNADSVIIIDDDHLLIDKNRRGPRDVAIHVTLRGDIARFEQESPK